MFNNPHTFDQVLSLGWTDWCFRGCWVLHHTGLWSSCVQE